MCLLPNSRASIDQAPGPIIANVAPSAANKRDGRQLPELDARIHACAMAISVPATGVHSPSNRQVPATALTVSGTISAPEDGSDRQSTP